MFLVSGTDKASAVEGGLGAYLLGSRDTLAGIVPPPGTYVSNDFIYQRGSLSDVSVGGVPVVSADVEVFIYKTSFTHVFDTELWGGSPALNMDIPFAHAKIGFSGPLASGIDDDETGLGDISVTGMVGWHSDKLHWSLGTTVFLPVGKYDTATVDIPAREIDALSTGKNVWAIQPTIAGTYLDPETGLEFSGALGVLFSEKNDATDYQTAPQLNLEVAALQHTGSGFAFGLSGYVYRQLSDDSGSGAAATKAALGTSSLQAEVYGVGPVITFTGKVLGNPLNFKLKYTHEFGAKRRIESDTLWLKATYSF